MTAHRDRRRQRGLTLIELMLALALGLVLVAAVYQIFLATARTARTTDAVSRRQDAIRYVSDRLAQDARMAGFRGCHGDQGTVRNTVNPDPAAAVPARTVTSHNDFRYRHDRYVEGFEATAVGWSPALPTGFPAPAAGSDVLSLRLSLGAEAFLVDDMTTTSDDLVIGGGEPLPFTAGDIVQVADCGGATVFAISAAQLITDAGSGAPQGRISHAAGSGPAPGNWSADLDRRFRAGAQIWRVGTVSWYVAASASDGRPALWRRTDDETIEIAGGVDALQVLYGEDQDGDRVADRYADASSYGDSAAWRRVVAVRVALLFSGSRDRVGVADPRTFDLLGTDVGPFDDGRLRRVVTLTLALRNRLP